MREAASPPRLADRLRARELGEAHRWNPSESLVLRRRCSRLELIRQRGISSPHAGGVTWLALDSSEQRYLLSCSVDATIALHDTHALDALPPHEHHHGLEPLCVVGHQHVGAHTYMVSSVAWYPPDTGLFVSGGHDHCIKLWDTNTLDMVLQWQMPALVSGVALSPLGGAASCLVGSACHDVLLRLCDLRSGATTHTLVGHRHPVWCLSWSACSEFELMSGDAHGQVLVWDVRMFGPVQVLNQYNTQHDSRQGNLPPEAPPAQLPRGLSPVGQAQREHPQARCEAGGARPAVDVGSAITLAWQAWEAQRRALRPLQQPRKHPRPAEHEEGTGQAVGMAPPQALPACIRVPWAPLPASWAGAMGVAATAHALGKRGRTHLGRDPDLSTLGAANNDGDDKEADQQGKLEGRGARCALRALPSRAGATQHPWPPAVAGSRAPTRAARGPTPALMTRPLSASAPLRPGGRSSAVIGGHAPPANTPVQGGSQAVQRAGAGSLVARGAGASSSGGGTGAGAVSTRAHQGSVTCVLPTPDGLFLLTGGTDSRLRLWDAMRWRRQLCSYADTFNHASRARQLAVTQDGTVAFHPTGSSVQVLHVHTGAQLAGLDQGHRESINAVSWNPLLGELYTGAGDGRILVWAVASRQHQRPHRRREPSEDSDSSSSSGGGDDQGNGPPHTGSSRTEQGLGRRRPPPTPGAPVGHRASGRFSKQPKQ